MHQFLLSFRCCFRPVTILVLACPTRRSSDLALSRALVLELWPLPWPRFRQRPDVLFEGGRSLSRFWLAQVKKMADRKSTRLNSSHRCISYAVFCLKKKKLINEPTAAANCTYI